MNHSVFLFAWVRSLPATDLMVVLTKSDKLSKSELAASRKAIATRLEIHDEDLIASSVTKKNGIDEIRRAMIARL